MAEPTKGLLIVLTNTKSQSLSLVSSKVIGSSSNSKVDLPQTVGHGTLGGYGTDASTTPYEVLVIFTGWRQNPPELRLQAQWAKGNYNHSLEVRSRRSELASIRSTQV